MYCVEIGERVRKVLRVEVGGWEALINVVCRFGWEGPLIVVCRDW